MAAQLKGEKVKGWKGEKLAAHLKGEKVKGWKGEKMAAPSSLLAKEENWQCLLTILLFYIA